jgi:hypothetical protein
MEVEVKLEGLVEGREEDFMIIVVSVINSFRNVLEFLEILLLL